MKKVIKKSNEKLFLNIRLPRFLMDKINNECDRLGMNKTAYVIMILNSYFEGRDLLKMGGMKENDIDTLTTTR